MSEIEQTSIDLLALDLVRMGGKAYRHAAERILRAEGIISAAQNELDAWRAPKKEPNNGLPLTLVGRIAALASSLVESRQR